ncbi:MAG TPA: hypothetical protein VFJ64_01950, partial [Solirubrobacterales bacterium]|nr:hypothetical protein [Solirubrobacterales bacterium]
MRARKRSNTEDGFTIVEVLIAAMILTLAALATFGVMASAVRNGQRAKQTQVALDRAQEEMEKLHSLTYKQLAMTTTPSHVTSTLNPNSRVVNGTFALQREPPKEYATMVVNGGSLYGSSKPIEGGLVTPGPISFKDGDVTGELYRYVVWRNDSKCPESEEGKKDYCPGPQDYKQIVVAAKLDTPGNQSAERGYVEVQSKAVDPSATANPTTGGGSSSSTESGGTGSTGKSVTAQQFFLT